MFWNTIGGLSDLTKAYVLKGWKVLYRWLDRYMTIDGTVIFLFTCKVNAHSVAVILGKKVIGIGQ